MVKDEDEEIDRSARILMASQIPEINRIRLGKEPRRPYKPGEKEKPYIEEEED